MAALQTFVGEPTMAQRKATATTRRELQEASIMSKNHDRLARRPPDERSASASVSKTTRPRSRTGFRQGLETATGRGFVSSSANRRGRSAQGLTGLAPSLGRIAAQAFRHIRIERVRAALADAQQLVRKHPLQAVLVGVGFGYLLSRTKVG